MSERCPICNRVLVGLWQMTSVPRKGDTKRVTRNIIRAYYCPTDNEIFDLELNLLKSVPLAWKGE